jgi:hypothetical protein
MQRANHAIELTRDPLGWTWALIGLDGEAAANGVADLQVNAMESAWRAARDLCGWAPDCFPEILLNGGVCADAAGSRDDAR